MKDLDVIKLKDELMNHGINCNLLTDGRIKGSTHQMYSEDQRNFNALLSERRQHMSFLDAQADALICMVGQIPGAESMIDIDSELSTFLKVRSGGSEIRKSPNLLL